MEVSRELLAPVVGFIDSFASGVRRIEAATGASLSVDMGTRGSRVCAVVAVGEESQVERAEAMLRARLETVRAARAGARLEYLQAASRECDPPTLRCTSLKARPVATPLRRGSGSGSPRRRLATARAPRKREVCGDDAALFWSPLGSSRAGTHYVRLGAVAPLVGDAAAELELELALPPSLRSLRKGSRPWPSQAEAEAEAASEAPLRRRAEELAARLLLPKTANCPWIWTLPLRLVSPPPKQVTELPRPPETVFEHNDNVESVEAACSWSAFASDLVPHSWRVAAPGADAGLEGLRPRFGASRALARGQNGLRRVCRRCYSESRSRSRSQRQERRSLRGE